MNFKNRTIFTGDNLEVMRGLNSESVDLIYADPPFNSKKQWSAPIGSQAAGAGFKDTWRLSDIDLAWHDELAVLNPALHDVVLAGRGAGGDSTMSYLLMMSVRLLEMKRILKPTGSLYLHCDPTESHSLKLMLDTIFGRDAFRNEIIWAYTGPGSPKMRQFNRKHDVILWYSVGDTWTFNRDDVRIPHKKLNTGGFDKNGERLDADLRDEYLKKGKIPETWWPDFSPVHRIHSERVGYPTQKPLALLDRIIRASSNPGDVVLDPFCGCATAAVASEELGRRWIGIDYSDAAYRLVKERMEQRYLEGKLDLFDFEIWHWDTSKEGNPRRTDLGDLPHYKTHKTSLYVEQEGHCNLCGVWFEQGNLTVDHIVPQAKGGTDHRENLHLLCRACNSRKGTRTWETVKADYLQRRRGGGRLWIGR